MGNFYNDSAGCTHDLDINKGIKKSMNKPNCTTCEFYESSACHLNPPISWDDMSYPRKGMYTKVSDHDWCSHYIAKAEEVRGLKEPLEPKPRGRPKGN